MARERGAEIYVPDGASGRRAFVKVQEAIAASYGDAAGPPRGRVNGGNYFRPNDHSTAEQAQPGAFHGLKVF